MPSVAIDNKPHGIPPAGAWPIVRDMALVGAVFLVFCLFIPLHWLTDFAIFCILVLSFDLLYGYMGHLSFGHMLYYGVGAYAASLTLLHLAPNPLLAIAVGLVAGLLVAAVMGLVVVQVQGAAFALVNLAINQIGFWLAMAGLQEYTHGEDGLPSSAQALGFLDFYNPPVAFGFMLACLLLVFGALRVLTTSPYGVMVRAIKENENRVKFLGYNTFAYKWLTFMIASTLAAFAGALYALAKGFVAPSDLNPLENTRIIFSVLIGGAGNLYGAVVGAVSFELMSNYLATTISRWELVLGAMLLALVFWFRQGITGFCRHLFLKLRHSRGIEG
ncbi:MAG: branched-chain amino acid ABC transporter permease [Thermodesulfobacteriota bacterium]